MPVPKLLREITESIHHPALVCAGETKTDDGQWALLAVVHQGTLPSILHEIRQLAGEFPVVFEERATRQTVARPAYPEQGE